MTPVEIGLISIIVLFLLMFSGMPIGIALGLVGFAGFAYLTHFEGALGMVSTTTYRSFASYDLTVVPLFILMGEFCSHGGVSQALYRAAYNWLGFLRGGLAMATTAACAAFAAITGSSAATVATIGTVALPEMKRYKYDTGLATGCIAAGGSMGILIPPSTSLIVYGLIAEQSIGKLFMAGFIPGVTEALFYMVTIYIMCKYNPALGPPGEKVSFRDKVSSFKDTWIVLLLFTVVMGGIYMGIFTPTEAAGVGAGGAFIYAATTRKITWRSLGKTLFETGITTGMIFLILLGANIFSYFLALSRLPTEVSGFIAGLGVNRYVIMLGIMILYLILGCFITGLAMIMLTVPVLLPLVVEVGFDPIWFGIIVTRAMEIGQITPPVGINVFIIKGVAKDVPMYTIFRGVIPFLIADFFHVTMLIAFPQVALFLPKLMR